MKEIRPIPYYSMPSSYEQRNCALALRKVFVPLIKRRLPNHHLVGFKQNFIPSYITQIKKEYPFFLRTDIQKFFPSVEARHLIVQMQLAYRDLLGLKFVPSKFKKTFLPPVVGWMNSLPISKGIPVGHVLSSVLAPISMIPLCIEMKRRFDVKFIVFMDDFLIFAKDEETARKVWIFLTNSLEENLHLQLNIEKTVSGRFATQAVAFCGWQICGGYITISKPKIETFKEKVHELALKSRSKPTRAFIKSLNRKIDGFGNYYKHGHVLRQFEHLDAFIRKEVRCWLNQSERPIMYKNSELEQLGLHSLQKCYQRLHQSKYSNQENKQPTPGKQYYEHKSSNLDWGVVNAIAANTEKLSIQMQQQLGFQRKMIKLLSELLGNESEYKMSSVRRSF